MLRGELYLAADPELAAERASAQAQLLQINSCAEPDARTLLLRNLLGTLGEGAEVRSPFFCDYGYNIHLGRNVFLNFDCVLLDILPIRIGDGTQIGPGVQIYAADHPRDPEVRRSGRELGRPVNVGANVWIGGGAILLPGITVGEDAVIGAGAVVTHDVPPGQIVAGNPARPIAKK